MYGQIEDSKTNSPKAANNAIQRNSGSNQHFAILDSRPEAARQLKIKSLLSNSRQERQAAQFQAIADKNVNEPKNLAGYSHTSSDHISQRVEDTTTSIPGNEAPIQMVRFLSVKRIAQGGSLYEGIGGAGPPALNHNGGMTWWGPRATAQVYAANGGTMWRSTAANPINLVDMHTPAKLGKTIRETIRRTNNNLSVPLQGVLQNHDFAYAVPQAVADAAQMCLDYAQAQHANQNGQWIANPYVNQVDVDNALALVMAPNQIPLIVGSVIQGFADHGSPNALQLDNANFLANPDNYVILRKDATNLDAAFTDALLNDLNQPNMAGEFHGLHVPAGMKFGGFTDTKHEIVIRNSPANLTAPVLPQPGDPDLAVSDKTLGVDDSILAKVWRWFGGNN